MSTKDADRNEGFECDECGRSFTSQRGLSNHEHHAHSEGSAKITVECVVCGTEDERYQSNVRNPGCCFCSTECEAEYKRNQPREEHPRWKGGEVTVECHTCETEKTVRPYQVERSERFFCNHECFAEWKSDTYPGSRSSKIAVSCDWCGDPTPKTPYRIERSERDFCSQKCNTAWQSENRHGPNHHQWKGGRRDYGPGWNEATRRAVRRRDGFQCVDCGFTQEQSIEQYGRKLDVHHLVPPGKGINPAVCNAVRNLVTLCLPCHRTRERKRTEQVKFAV